MVTEPFVHLDNVCKDFIRGDQECVHAVRNLTLSVSRGEFVSIVGTSGSGKSTILHLLGGMDTVTSGRITIGDKVISDYDENGRSRYRQHSIGFIFQTFYLLPHLSVYENVSLPLLISGKTQQEIDEIVPSLLRTVGLSERTAFYPRELSGGQQQRVAIARALAPSPQILLADEPTGNLDHANGIAIMNLLEEVNATRNITVVLVTHDQTLASRAHTHYEMTDGVLSPFNPQPFEGE